MAVGISQDAQAPALTSRASHIPHPLQLAVACPHMLYVCIATPPQPRRRPQLTLPQPPRWQHHLLLRHDLMQLCMIMSPHSQGHWQL